MNKLNKIKASDHKNYWAFLILTILVPFVGTILGIIYLSKDNLLDIQLGKYILILSIIMLFIYSVLM